MTADELAAIRARADAATPGPWRVYVRFHPNDADVNSADGRLVVWRGKRKECVFIAHARTDVPALLAHIDALEAENAELRAVMRQAWAWHAPHGWIDHNQRDYQHERPFCAECSAPVTYHRVPNDRGGTCYAGYTCAHTSDCMIGRVETLLGGLQYVSPDADTDGRRERDQEHG